MANNSNNKNQPKRKVVRINLSSILYLVLLVVIGTSLFRNTGSPAQKLEWAQVKEMMQDGDIKEIHFIRNDFKGNITIRPDSLAKYAEYYPKGILPKKSLPDKYLDKARE